MKKRNAYVTLAVLLLIFIGCQKKDTTPLKPEPEKFKKPETIAVVGGQPTNINTVPYQVAVYIDGSLGGYGGGVILSDQWIVTAAHVVHDVNGSLLNANRITARYGSSLRSQSHTAAVDQVLIHPDYSGSGDRSGDIALLHLSTALSFSVNAAPIVYSTPGDQISTNMIATVSGWGSTDHAQGNAPDQLSSVPVRISSLNDPYLVYTLTTSSSQQSSCTGDSGGPLTVEIPGFGEALIGIVNGWNNCNDINDPKGYARISRFASWIKDKTGGVDRPSIQGSSTICYGSATYNISNLVNGAIVTWSITTSSGSSTQNTPTVSQTSDSSATLNYYGSTSGVYTLTASVNIYGRIYNYSKQIYCGSVDSGGSTISGSSSSSAGAFQSYSIPAVTGATSYTWTVPGNWTIHSGQGTRVLNVKTGSKSGFVKVRVTNQCGLGYPAFKEVQIY